MATSSIGVHILQKNLKYINDRFFLFSLYPYIVMIDMITIYIKWSTSCCASLIRWSSWTTYFILLAKEIGCSFKTHLFSTRKMKSPAFIRSLVGSLTRRYHSMALNVDVMESTLSLRAVLTFEAEGMVT